MDLGTPNEMWTQTGEKLTTFPSTILLDIRLTEATRKFMDTCRFPISAAPFLEFLDGQNTLPTLSQYYRINWEGMGNYLVIGYNGSGDPICVDTEANDEIIYLNHDRSFERVLINTTIERLSRSLLAYKEFIGSLHGSSDPNDMSMRKFSDAEFSFLQGKFQDIDEKAIQEGTFWQMELDMLLWERDH